MFEHKKALHVDLDRLEHALESAQRAAGKINKAYRDMAILAEFAGDRTHHLCPCDKETKQLHFAQNELAEALKALEDCATEVEDDA